MCTETGHAETNLYQDNKRHFFSSFILVFFFIVILSATNIYILEIFEIHLSYSFRTNRGKVMSKTLQPHVVYRESMVTKVL